MKKIKIKRTKKNVFIVKSILFIAMIVSMVVFGSAWICQNIAMAIISLILSVMFGGCFGTLDELSSEWFDSDAEKEARINYVYTLEEYENRNK